MPTNKALRLIRYILFFATLFYMFNNLVDNLKQGAPLTDYLVFVLILLIMALSFVFIPSNKIIPIMFFAGGVLTLIDCENAESINGGVLFIVFGLLLLKKHLIYTVIAYLGTIACVCTVSVMQNGTAADALNVSGLYCLVYCIQYIYLPHREVK